MLIIIRTITVMGEIMYRKSRQRERILEILQNTDTHPSADIIYEKMKPEFRNLSLGTVYRNLSILLQQGKVKKLDFGSTFDRYDAQTGPHYHFMCEKCGSIIDLDIEVDEYINTEVQKKTDFIVNSHRLEFFGLCSRCRI